MQASDMTGWARRIRQESLKMIHLSTGGHPGGALSIAEIVAVLYFDVMNVKPDDPKWPDRDRLVLSKGHGCAAVYAALGLKGFFPVEHFKRFRRIDGLLQGHPSINIPGIDAPSGSLGLGLSQGLGMALGAKKSSRSFRTYVILGDGDMQEGNTWEAIMAAAHMRLDNLCAILDANGLQADGKVDDTMCYEPAAAKLTAFGWNVVEIDGHDNVAVGEAFLEAAKCKNKPTFIIARTVKGKGVSFMENISSWHGTVRISDQQLEQALSELAPVELLRR